MTPENFVYWLQGYFELLHEDGQEITLTQKQIKCIQDHLGYVFEHQNPVKETSLKEALDSLRKAADPRPMAPEFDLSDLPRGPRAKIC